MIKPSDIPDDFVKIAEELFKEGHWSHAEKHVAAEFLNAAIEAGLVVPASEAKVLRRALALLRTIRDEGYTPGGAGSIAIDERIKELESEGKDDQA